MIRPFRLCGATEASETVARCREAMLAWQRDWLPSSAPTLELSVGIGGSAMSTDLGAEWLMIAGAKGTCWASPTTQAGLERLLCGGSSRPRSIASTISRMALDALMSSIAGCAERTESLPAEGVDRLFEHGRPILTITLGGCERISLLLEQPDDRPAQRAGTGALALPIKALSEQPVQLEVVLGTAELELGQLVTLASGDVLRLGTRLDQSVEMRVAGERLSCAGYVGVAEGRLAIELSRS